MHPYLCVYSKPYISNTPYYIYAENFEEAQEKFDKYLCNILGERLYDMENLIIVELNEKIEVISIDK